MSAEQLDVARFRKAFASLESGGTRAVDSERIFDAIHGDLSVEERQAMVDELRDDADAAEAWRLALELTPEPLGRPRSLALRRVWLPVAAAAALVMMAGWQLTAPRLPVDEPAYRGLATRGIASALPPGAAITRATPTLRWTGIDGARYRVRVLRPDLRVIEPSDELTRAEYTLTRAALDQVPTGGQIFWQVTARIPGEAIVESPTFSTRVE